MGCQRSNLISNNFPVEQPKDQIKIESVLGDPTPPSIIKQSGSELSGREIILIRRAIEKHILFYKLDVDQRMRLISSMERVEVPAGRYIFREKEEPDYAYIISAGSVRIELVKQGREVKKILQEGSVFGDLALINVSSRSASALALTPCSLIALSRQAFHEKMEELAKEHHHLFFDFIDSAPTFKKLAQAQKASLATHMHEARFEKGSVIFQLGDFANCIYLIKSGEVEVSAPQKTAVVLKTGDIFGEGSLKQSSVRAGQAKALTSVHCFVISKTKLSLCVESEDIRYITFHCIICWALRRSSKFQKVGKAVIERVIENGEIVEVEDGEVMATAGQEMNKLMICLEGEVFLENLYRTLRREGEEVAGVGSIFNEDYETPTKSPFTITKRSKGSCFSIEHRKLRSIFHPMPHRMSISLTLPPEPEFSLRDFELLKKLQSSALCSKYLVMDCRAKLSYTMHVFDKVEAVEYKREGLLLNDRELNLSLRQRAVINLVRTFKDARHLYFVYREYLSFTLDGLIKRVSFPNAQTIDFIIMTLINFLQYLHGEMIIFRDLKPENIILDRDGYPRFLSFMLAKKLARSSFKTYTILGTPHYLAPEVQEGLGYSFPADFWSLGVIVYQLAVGSLPFADDKEDPYEIFLAVQRQKLSFPKSFANKRLKKLIKLLLCKESWNRPDHITIKTCGYFSEVSPQQWRDLEQGNASCPEEIEKLVAEYSEELSLEALNETQGSFMAIFERERSRFNSPPAAGVDCSWDEEF